MKTYVVIGEILEDGTILKGQSEQGLIFKDRNAFVKQEGICYVPELSDTKYTYKDFLDMAKGNADIAKELFNAVDWQSPETKLEEWMDEDEVHECSNCNKMFLSYEIDECPFCNAEKSF